MNQDNEIRGHLFTLIVYALEEKCSEYFQRVVQPFIEKFPCRVIFIRSYAEQGKNKLQAPLITHDSQNTKCDQIVIQVPQPLLHTVPLLVLPRLVPDLPIYLVWGQNPTSDDENLPVLQNLATRFVFEAECATNLQEFSKKMLKNIADLKIDFMDVSWANIGGWRDVFSQTFNTAEKLTYLHQCNRMLIKYNPSNTEVKQHSAIQAIFLQGWLAAELKWNYQSISYHDGIFITYKTPFTPIEVHLSPQERPSLSPGRIFEVEFENMSRVTTTLTLAEKQSKVMIYVSTPEKCELPFSLPIPDISKGLTAMNEVFYYKAGSHYQHMLETIKQIPWEGF